MSGSHSHHTIDVWADLVCPWCYLGDSRLRQAIETAAPGQFELRVRSFELRPEASDTPQPLQEMLRAHLGASQDDVTRMESRMSELAKREALPISPERRVGNTVRVHRVLQAANQHGVGSQWFSTLQRGYFGGDLDPFDDATLIHTAEQAGLPAQAAEEALTDERYLSAVRADETEAQAIGISGVPFALIDRKWAIPGAQETGVFTQALRQIMAEEPAAG
jgi:predicted DsbA family dithiol-disulfide isomerase